MTSLYSQTGSVYSETAELQECGRWSPLQPRSEAEILWSLTIVLASVRTVDAKYHKYPFLFSLISVTFCICHSPLTPLKTNLLVVAGQRGPQDKHYDSDTNIKTVFSYMKIMPLCSLIQKRAAAPGWDHMQPSSLYSSAVETADCHVPVCGIVIFSSTFLSLHTSLNSDITLPVLCLHVNDILVSLWFLLVF